MLGFHHDFAAGDPDAVDVIAQSDVPIIIGTDPAEFLIGGPNVRAILRRQVEEIGGFKVETSNVHAFEEGTFGWAACEFLATMRNGGEFTVRASYVFRREDDRWRMLHYHWSFGVTNVETLGMELTTSLDGIAELVDRERPDLNKMASAEGTVTIMFTDLESSTALNETLGDDSYLPLLLLHHDIVKTHVGSSAGTIVKSEGDGFMLAFPSARRAVECAIAVQRDTSRVDGRLKVRMGLHTGEPAHRADDFFGRDVAYAARVGSVAVGGEILVSSLVRSLVEPSGTVLFEDARPVELKGFDGQQLVSAVLWTSGPG